MVGSSLAIAAFLVAQGNTLVHDVLKRPADLKRCQAGLRHCERRVDFIYAEQLRLQANSLPTRLCRNTVFQVYCATDTPRGEGCRGRLSALLSGSSSDAVLTPPTSVLRALIKLLLPVRPSSSSTTLEERRSR